MVSTKTIELEFDIKLPLGSIEKTIVHTQVPVYAGYEAIIDELVDLAYEARRNIASRHLDFEASGGDSFYLDTLNRMSDGYGISGLHIHDPEAKPRRYAFGAEWPDADNRYEDSVTAVNPLDAELQAAWKMAVGTEHGERNGDTPKGFEEIVEYISEIDVDYVAEEPLNLEEAGILLQEFYLAHHTGDDIDAVLDRVKSALEALNLLPEIPGSTPTM